MVDVIVVFAGTAAGVNDKDKEDDERCMGVVGVC